MSDVEHEFVLENRLLRDEVAHLRSLAERAVQAAIAAQDAAGGDHEPWLDDALADLVPGASAETTGSRAVTRDPPP